MVQHWKGWKAGQWAEQAWQEGKIECMTRATAWQGMARRSRSSQARAGQCNAVQSGAVRVSPGQGRDKGRGRGSGSTQYYNFAEKLARMGNFDNFRWRYVDVAVLTNVQAT